MYKVISSFWSSSANTRTIKKKTRLLSKNSIEEDWVFVSDAGILTNHVDNALLTPDSQEIHNSWIATPPLIAPSTSQTTTSLNPIDNLLIEHPSMSVYDQITRPRRRRKIENKNPIKENDLNDQQEQCEKSDITTSFIQLSRSSTTDHRSLSKSSSTSNNDISSHLSKLNASETSASISSSLCHYHRRRTHVRSLKPSPNTKNKPSVEQQFVQRQRKNISTLHHTSGINHVRILQQPHQRTLYH